MSLLDFLGIGSALAEAAQTAATSDTTQGGSFLHMLPMLILFIAVFYFLLVRPQTKRSKEHKKLMSNLAIGDEIMTAGGIMGRLVKVKDTYIVISVAKNVEIVFQKNAITSILPKGTIESLE